MYCSKCGSEISATSAFCSHCGQSISSQTTALPSLSPVVPTAPEPVVPVMPAPTYSVGVAYAGFWLRFVAFIVDSFIACFAFIILLIPLFVLTGAGAALGRIFSDDDIGDNIGAFMGVGFTFGFFAIVLVVSWLYYALSESSSWQATPGKKMLNLKVTDLSGEPITFARASGRYFSKIITNLIPLCIGYIMAGFTEKKQAIHDMIASCLVLRKI